MASSLPSSSPKLWLALRLVDLPCEVLGLGSAAASLAKESLVAAPATEGNLQALQEQGDSSSMGVLVEQRQKIIYACAHSKEQGVQVGMDITTAQVLSQGQLYSRQEQSEEQALAVLAEQLYQFTPYIKTYQGQDDAGLLLELSRCLNLFKGLNNLCEQILRQVALLGHECLWACAYSEPGAWLLSSADSSLAQSLRAYTEFESQVLVNKSKTNSEKNREDKATEAVKDRPFNEPKLDINYLQSDVIERALCRLPLSALQSFPKVVTALYKTGFSCLGDVAKQIKDESLRSLRMRFGEDFAEYLAQVFNWQNLGLQSDLFQAPQRLYQPKELFEQSLQFDYPVHVAEQLHPAMAQLLDQLSAYLLKRQLECQSIEWTLSSIHHQRDRFYVHSDAAQTQCDFLLELSKIKLENHPLDFEVDTLQLRCEHSSKIHNRDQRLDFNPSQRSRQQQQDFALVAAKLKSRLGEGALFKVSYADSLIPEDSNIKIAPQQNCAQSLPACVQQSLRPSWLLTSPSAVSLRAKRLYWHGYLQVLAGPERIEAQWWAEAAHRDYFVARRDDGLHCWLFKDLKRNSWYVQGLFA